MNTLLIITTILILLGHHLTQKKILKISIHKENPKNEINRLIFNGIILMVLAIISLMYYVSPYGLIGILIFIESSVSFSFAYKLIKKK